VAETISLIDGVLTTHHVIHDQLHTTHEFHVRQSIEHYVRIISNSRPTNQYIGRVEFINSGVYELISTTRRVCWFCLQTTLLTSLLIKLMKFGKVEKTLWITNHLIFIVKYTYENKYCILIMTTIITMKIRCTKVDQNCPKYTGKCMEINQSIVLIMTAVNNENHL